MLRESKFIRLCLWPIIVIRRRFFVYLAKRRDLDVFRYDAERFAEYSGAAHCDNKEAWLARLIMTYHVVEKGLTMPRRRLDFGHETVRELMRYISEFETVYGPSDSQVVHASGVVKDYLAMHTCAGFDFGKDKEYWAAVVDFCSRHTGIEHIHQLHVSREEFFSRIDAPFAEFAKSRHTVRHYDGEVCVEKVRKAVQLSMTAPSACNRQHVRVHCISNHVLRDAIFEIHHGNRGFGRDADKVLCITADLADLRGWEERNDIYVNAGIFIMNLCYALHAQRIVHCVLNWHAHRDEDMAVRKLLPIAPSETIVAFISCGNAPDEFDIAASPRKCLADIFTEHK